LAETLQTECPNVDVTVVELENEGVCLKFAPLESAQGTFIKLLFNVCSHGNCYFMYHSIEVKWKAVVNICLPVLFRDAVLNEKYLVN